MNRSQELRLRASRCRMVAARYPADRRQPLLDLARELELEADALDNDLRRAGPQ
ncbi:MAG TPA: hypothetical protein VEX35_02255 [Allosphingosinicella sp.]|nr:hypothetical protein [Allosphingosinicella sp.]